MDKIKYINFEVSYHFIDYENFIFDNWEINFCSYLHLSTDITGDHHSHQTVNGYMYTTKKVGEYYIENYYVNLDSYKYGRSYKIDEIVNSAIHKLTIDGRKKVFDMILGNRDNTAH